MEKIVIKVKSSSHSGYYNVIFDCNNDDFSLRCDCKAGSFGKLCKHKRLVALCDLEIAFDDFQKRSVILLYKRLKDLGFYDKIYEIESDLSQLEKQKKEIIKKENLLKLKLEKCFREGIIDT